MTDKLISFETAKLAKEKKFDWEVSNAFVIKHKKVSEEDSYYYNHNGSLNLNPLKDNLISEIISRPTQSLLQKWLREKPSMYVYVIPINTKRPSGNYEINVYKNNERYFFDYGFNTYEEALEKGLQEALKLI